MTKLSKVKINFMVVLPLNLCRPVCCSECVGPCEWLKYLKWFFEIWIKKELGKYDSVELLKKVNLGRNPWIRDQQRNFHEILYIILYTMRGRPLVCLYSDNMVSNNNFLYFLLKIRWRLHNFDISIVKEVDFLNHSLKIQYENVIRNSLS